MVDVRSSSRVFFVAVSVAIVFGAIAADARALPPSAPAYSVVSDGEIDTVERSGTRAFVGGVFSRIMEPRGPAVLLDATSGAALDPFPTLAGQGVPVTAVESDGAGGWFLGRLTVDSGASPTRVTHVLANGTVDTNWDAQIVGQGVWTMARVGATLYIGGSFTSVRGVSRQNIAAVSVADGALISGFVPASPNSAVKTLAVSGAKVYIGGYFDTVASSARQYLAALDATSGALDATFNAQNNAYPVVALAVSGGVVYSGGLGGASAVNGDSGALISAWRPQTGDVLAIAVSGTSVYLGGFFTSAGITPRNHVAAVDSLTATVLPWNPNVDGAVSSLRVVGGKVYLGGQFATVGGTARARLARVDGIDASLDGWNPSLNSPPAGIAAAGNDILVGGAIAGVGGALRAGLAAVNATTGELDPAWLANATPAGVTHLATLGSRLYVGGGYIAINGVPRDSLTAVSTTDGAVDTNWNSEYSFTSEPTQLLASGGRLYATDTVPYTDTLGSYGRVPIVALDPGSGSTIAGWQQPSVFGALNSTGQVFGLAAADCRLFAAGSFATVNGTQVQGAAQRDSFAAFGLSGVLDPYLTSVTAGFGEIAISGTTMYVAGTIQLAPNTSPVSVAAIDIRTNAILWSRTVTPYGVDSIAISNQGLVIGGGFDIVDGVPRQNLALLNASTGEVLAWAPNTLYGIKKLVVREGALLAVGSLYPGQTQSTAAAVFTGFGDAPAAAACGSGGGSGGGGGGGTGVSDLKVELSASRTTVSVGEESNLVATITNHGTQTSVHTHLLITLPPTATLLGPPAFDRGSGCTGSQAIDCNLDFLPVGVPTKVVFAVRIGGPGTITATASASREANPADNTATVSLQLPPPPLPPTRTPSSSKGVTRTGTARTDILMGTAYPDVLRGLGGNDSINGKASADKLYGGGGNDTIVGGGGLDLIQGDAGNDRITTRDGQRDTVRCGTGKDIVTADRKDTVSRDCETVRRT